MDELEILKLLLSSGINHISGKDTHIFYSDGTWSVHPKDGFSCMCFYEGANLLDAISVFLENESYAPELEDYGISFDDILAEMKSRMV